MVWGQLGLKDEMVAAEAKHVTDLRRAPFDRVENGYDPHQVAAFAAEALTWKRDLAATRKALAETLAELEQHIALATASNDADESYASAPSQTETFQPSLPESTATETTVFDRTSTAYDDSEFAPIADDDELASTVDPLNAIFEVTREPEPEETDAEVLREQRVAAAAANLWKRRGVLTPQE